jgi:hypothetical protein
LPDYVVVAEETSGADPEDPTRTVFVIEQKPEGKFVIAARNDRAVISKANGGLSDSFEGIKAEKEGIHAFVLRRSAGQVDRQLPSVIRGLAKRGS